MRSLKELWERGREEMRERARITDVTKQELAAFSLAHCNQRNLSFTEVIAPAAVMGDDND